MTAGLRASHSRMVLVSFSCLVGLKAYYLEHCWSSVMKASRMVANLAGLKECWRARSMAASTSLGCWMAAKRAQKKMV